MATQADVDRWKEAFEREEKVRKRKREQIKAYRKTPKGIAYMKKSRESKRYKEYQKEYYETVTKLKRKK